MQKPQPWLERCKATARFHRSRLALDDKWTEDKTAAELRLSIGAVCQYLLIASWLKTHSTQIEKCEYIKDALKFIRLKKKEMKLQGD